MANEFASGIRQLPSTAGGPQQLLDEFPTYAGAERLVDRLSDAGFPVQHTRIVGNGLRTVEYVTGRLTNGRAALAGLAGGAWIGLLIGLLLGLFTPDHAWLGVLLAGPLIGALWGGDVRLRRARRHAGAPRLRQRQGTRGRALRRLRRRRPRRAGAAARRCARAHPPGPALMR